MNLFKEMIEQVDAAVETSTEPVTVYAKHGGKTFSIEGYRNDDNTIKRRCFVDGERTTRRDFGRMLRDVPAVNGSLPSQVQAHQFAVTSATPAADETQSMLQTVIDEAEEEALRTRDNTIRKFARMQLQVDNMKAAMELAIEENRWDRVADLASYVASSASELSRLSEKAQCAHKALEALRYVQQNS